MANKKISALTAASAFDGTELFETVQGGTNKKGLVSALRTFMGLTFATKENPNGLALGPRSVLDPSCINAARGVGLADRAVYYRVIDGGTITGIAAQVVVAADNISVGVYAPTGVGPAALPGARKATSGSVACPAAGYRVIDLGGSVDVDPGDWLAISAHDVTCTFFAVAGIVAASPIAGGQQAYQETAHPLPANAAATAGIINGIALNGVA